MSATPLDFLLSRRSVKFVRVPGPDDDELSLIFEAAMRAPDHGRLQPWRFRLIRGKAISDLAELAISASRAAGRPLTPEKEATTRRWLDKVPLVIAIACRLDHSNTKIPEHERMLATGAAVTNMLNAAHMLGYGGFWSTGLGTYVEEVGETLGFDALDYRFMGFLTLGTPIQSSPPPNRPDFRQFVTEWEGS